PVNVAARLQTAAPTGGVLVGPTTALGVAGSIALEDAGSLTLKGKSEPLHAWHAIAALAEPSRDHAMGSLRAPMVGRDEEMHTLLSALGGVEDGGQGRMTVVAPPGVGKTRLVDEFADAARERGVAIRRARLRPDVVVPYAGVAQLLLAALGDAAPDPQDGGSFDRSADLLIARLRERGAPEDRARVVADDVLALLAERSSPVDAGPGSDERRESMFRSWLDAFDALTDGPEIWIVEDVHWSGADLLAFLDLAGRAVSTDGRLVVCTARPSILEHADAWLRGEGSTTFALPPLSTPDARRLIHELVGDAVPPELADGIVERSDGNPLFIEELLRTWSGTGLLVQDKHGWRLAEAAAEIRLPATVQAIYAAQLDDLPHAARTVARNASVAGRRFPVDALESLEAGEAAPPGIDVLTQRALLAGPTADPLVGRTFAYRHALLRDAGYASLSRADRARLHIRLACWLESVAGADRPQIAEMIGVQYERALDSASALAGDLGEGLDRSDVAALAAHWLGEAARWASGIAAYDAARTLLERSFDLTPEDDVQLRAQRLLALGEATAFGADMDEGLRRAQDAMAAFRAQMTTAGETAGARDGYTRAAALVGRVYGQQLRFHDMVELGDQVLREIGDRDDVATARMLVTRALGLGMISDAQLEDDGPGLERAIAIARAAGDHDLELDALAILARDVADFEAIEAAAVEHGRWDVAIKAARVQGGMLLPDHAAESLRAADRIATLAQSRGFTEEQAWDDYLRTECGLVSGDWTLAWDAGLRAIDLGERNAYHRAAVRTWAALIPIADATARTHALRHARVWYVEHDGVFPDSPYGRLIRSSASLAMQRAGLDPISDSSPAWLEGSIESEWEELPSWFAGIEIVVRSWLELGEIDAVRTWLRRYEA
ncbi:MAG: ATP-binding protein, partial [Actinomycetota bacterium]